MRIEHASSARRDFREVVLEDRDELHIAIKAASRAVRRTRGYVPLTTYSSGHRANKYIGRPALGLWNHCVGVIQQDLRPLEKARTEMLLAANSGNSITIAKGNQPDTLVRAIADYYEPAKTGNDFIESRPDLQHSIDRLVGAAIIALEDLVAHEPQLATEPSSP